MRTEYEFELGGDKFLAKADARGKVHAYEWADDDSGWVGMDFGPNPFAGELLRLARILDSLVGRSWLAEGILTPQQIRDALELADRLDPRDASERAFDAADDASRAEEGLVEDSGVPPPAQAEREARDRGEL